MENSNKLTKVIFEYEDGTQKYIEEVELEKWIFFNVQVELLASSHKQNPKWENIKWKTINPDQIFY